MATTLEAIEPVLDPSSWLPRQLPGSVATRWILHRTVAHTATSRASGSARTWSTLSPSRLDRDILVTSAKKFQKGMALQRAKRLLGEGLLTSEGQAHLRHGAPSSRCSTASRCSARRHDGEACPRWRDPPRRTRRSTSRREWAALTLAIVGETPFSSTSGDADRGPRLADRGRAEFRHRVRAEFPGAPRAGSRCRVRVYLLTPLLLIFMMEW